MNLRLQVLGHLGLEPHRWRVLQRRGDPSRHLACLLTLRQFEADLTDLLLQLRHRDFDDVEKILGLGLGDLSENFRRENQIPPSIKGVAVITVDEDSEAFSKKIAKGSVIISLTHQRVSGNVTLQSTVKAESYQQVYDLLNQRKKEGDERILLRVWRPELRLVSLVALSFSQKNK